MCLVKYRMDLIFQKRIQKIFYFYFWERGLEYIEIKKRRKIFFSPLLLLGAKTKGKKDHLCSHWYSICSLLYGEPEPHSKPTLPNFCSFERERDGFLLQLKEASKGIALIPSLHQRTSPTYLDFGSCYPFGYLL